MFNVNVFISESTLVVYTIAIFLIIFLALKFILLVSYYFCYAALHWQGVGSCIIVVYVPVFNKLVSVFF